MKVVNLDRVEVHPGPNMTMWPKREDVLTQAELLATLTERFGEHARNWAFVCPNCGDVATGADFKAALEADPRTRRDGTVVTASDIMGQQCIGRVLGALSRPRTKRMEDSRNWGGRGCDWAAGGLFSGPMFIEIRGPRRDARGRFVKASTRLVPSFRVAPAQSREPG